MNTRSAAPKVQISEARFLDAELAYHTVEPTSWAIIKNSITPEMVLDDDAREIFEYQLWHDAQYGHPATCDALNSRYEAALLRLSEPDKALMQVLPRKWRNS